VKASADLIEAWRAAPQSRVAVIVHVDGPPEQYREDVVKSGLVVERVFRLTNTIAACGLACHVLDLLEALWVRRIELDAQITTMN
jgi:hypothetical protein